MSGASTANRLSERQAKNASGAGYSNLVASSPKVKTEHWHSIAMLVDLVFWYTLKPKKRVAKTFSASKTLLMTNKNRSGEVMAAETTSELMVFDAFKYNPWK